MVFCIFKTRVTSIVITAASIVIINKSWYSCHKNWHYYKNSSSTAGMVQTVTDTNSKLTMNWITLLENWKSEVNRITYKDLQQMPMFDHSARIVTRYLLPYYVRSYSVQSLADDIHHFHSKTFCHCFVYSITVITDLSYRHLIS